MAETLVMETGYVVYGGYLLAFVLATLACLAAAWRARQIPYKDTRYGLVAFFLASGGWAATYVGFLLSNSFLAKNLFYEASLIVGFGAVWAWLWFCSAYSGRALHRNWAVRKFVIAVFAVITTLKVTNPLHGLYYSLEPSGGAFGLVVEHKTFYWVVMAMSYSLASAGYLMLLELFLKTDVRTAPLAGLTALTALPAGLNVIGHVSPALRDVTHEPLGVAVFAMGVLFAYRYQFSAVRVAGSLEQPTLMLGANGEIRDYGGGASEAIPHLEPSGVGERLEAIQPDLADQLDEERPVWKTDCGSSPEYYRVTETSLAGMKEGRAVILSDITHRERQRRTLHRRNDLFERAQALAGVGAWEYDLDAETLRWTDEVYEIYGVDDTFEPTLETAIALVHPEDRVRIREGLRRVIEEKQPQDLEVRLCKRANLDGDDLAETPCRDGDPSEASPQGSERARWIRVRGVPRRTGGDRAGPNGHEQTGEGASEAHLVRGAVQDITEQKRRERRLRTAKEEAEEASHLKSAMLANMSHEIRTPLTSIIGFAEAIGEQVDVLKDRSDERDLSTLNRFAGLIEKSGHRLLETLDGVLNLSKLESGQMELDASTVNLVRETEDVVEELRPQAEKHGVQLELEQWGDTPYAAADDGGLQIVARNLISNAIKYTEEGGNVYVRTRQADETAVLEVEDTGIGMDSEIADDLFEPFRQESEGLGREFEGTGLGLAITRKAVEEMEGTVEVETEKGEGSRFTVYLPEANGSMNGRG